MLDLDASQQRVLGLDPARHARVIGAAGSGTTTLLIRVLEKLFDENVLTPRDTLVFAHHREASVRLRDAIESRVQRPFTGRLVRTAASFAFSVVSHERLRDNARATPELMIGSRQDQFLNEIVSSSLETTLAQDLHPEVLESDRFRGELRELWRVLDEAERSPKDLLRAADDLAAVTSDTVHEHVGLSKEQRSGYARVWRFAAHLLDAAGLRMQTEFPEDLTASGVIREAVRVLTEPGASLEGFDLPALVLVDAAQELTEGALRLLAACANRGSKVWFFGDPDSATGAFQGEHTGVLRSVHDELRRLGARPAALQGDEQVVTLEAVYRHGQTLRTFLSELAERVGVAGEWSQRAAPSRSAEQTTVEATRTHGRAEQIGVIAHRLQREQLGLGTSRTPIDWASMAVICRSNDEAAQVSRLLESNGIPTTLGTGGVVVREQVIARHLIEMLLMVLDHREPDAETATTWLIGPVGGLDPVGARRLRATCMLAERKRALLEERTPRAWATLLIDTMNDPELVPDSAEGRRLKRVMKVFDAGRNSAALGGHSPREVLWNMWDATGLADSLRERALQQPDLSSAMANQALDSVMAVFFALQRHEERVSDVPITELLEELRTTSVAQDTLAHKSRRTAVLVTTPQGAAGREFDVVAIVGPQDGAWPNLRTRGMILGLPILEQFFRHGVFRAPNRLDTLHDELRLFVSACSRPRQQLLIVAREDDETFPSMLFQLASAHEVKGLPNTNLTLRGQVASLRRALHHDPNNAHAAKMLALLARHGISAADPQHWYGMRELSTTDPLVDLSAPDAQVRVSPSAIDTAETCPLNWVLDHLGAQAPFTSASIGTLVHHIFETSHETGVNVDEWNRVAEEQWENLEFDAEWESDRTRETVRDMLTGVRDYVRASEAANHEVVATEAGFRVTLGQTTVSGVVDRIELRTNAAGTRHIVVVDLKTGTTSPKLGALDEHPQMLAYQLGVELGALELNEEDQSKLAGIENSGGASLLYVSPEVQRQHETYREFRQTALTDEMRKQFLDRLEQVSQTMAAASFEAKVEHHCMADYRTTPCQLHIIPAVSFE